MKQKQTNSTKRSLLIPIGEGWSNVMYKDCRHQYTQITIWEQIGLLPAASLPYSIHNFDRVWYTDSAAALRRFISPQQVVRWDKCLFCLWEEEGQGGRGGLSWDWVGVEIQECNLEAI